MVFDPGQRMRAFLVRIEAFFRLVHPSKCFTRAHEILRLVLEIEPTRA